MKRTLLAIYGLMPASSGSPESMASKIELTLEILSDLDPIEVNKTLKRFLNGEIGDGRFAPTVAQIRRATTDGMLYGTPDLRYKADRDLDNEQYWLKRKQQEKWGRV